MQYTRQPRTLGRSCEESSTHVEALISLDFLPCKEGLAHELPIPGISFQTQPIHFHGNHNDHSAGITKLALRVQEFPFQTFSLGHCHLLGPASCVCRSSVLKDIAQ